MYKLYIIAGNSFQHYKITVYLKSCLQILSLVWYKIIVAKENVKSSGNDCCSKPLFKANLVKVSVLHFKIS